jgi:hypothetical protein
MKSIVGLLAVVASCLSPVGDAIVLTASEAPTVTIDSGAVVGVATSPAGASATVNKYLGIPFGASPVRFAPAVRPRHGRNPFKPPNTDQHVSNSSTIPKRLATPRLHGLIRRPHQQVRVRTV